MTTNEKGLKTLNTLLFLNKKKFKNIQGLRRDYFLISK
jgi:hypothetical protein